MGRSNTYEEVLEIVTSRQGILLTSKETYISEKMNRLSLLTIVCYCGETILKSLTDFRNYPRCSNHSEERRKATCKEKYGFECCFQAQEVKEKTKATCKERYGTEYPCQTKEVQEKRKSTCQERYGVDCASKNKEVQEKAKSTCQEKYGTDFASQRQEVQEKIKATCKEKYGFECCFQAQEVKEKSKATCTKKFGFEYASQSKEIQDKRAITCQERYGETNPLKNLEVREKAKATCKERYGVEFSSQSQEIKDKVKASNLERHGYEYCLQNPDILAKQLKSCYNKKEYPMPSGKVIFLQGDEPYYMDVLLQTYYEEDILSDTQDMPDLWYILNGEYHRYFPDFYIPKDNLIIEVKSTWTITQHKLKNVEKFKTVKATGYNLKIIVFDDKKQMTDVSHEF